jgi:hypothetical protein
MWIWVILFIAAVVGGVLGWYFWPKKKNDTPAKGDTIIISDEGTKLETYIEMPRFQRCLNSSPDPKTCDSITSDTEMNYVYDPLGGSLKDSGEFKTTFNYDTQLCSDGTTDCVYEEKISKDRKLIGITNSKGEDFIKKFIDDVWSGKIDLNKEVPNPLTGEKTALKNQITQIIDFDRTSGELFFNMNEKVKIVPGYQQFNDNEKEMKASVGMIILYIIFYYYGNNLPKPTIKLDLSSEKTLGEVYFELKSKLPPSSSAGSGTSGD